MDPEEKNKISHRGKALEQIKEFLKNNYESLAKKYTE
jgi:inosine/xanthosine triphosphate pyrophosphatase family protein